MRPDAKSQVTLRYEDGKPIAVDAVVLSTQQSDITLEDLRDAVKENIILPILPPNWLHADTKYHINPTGNFVIGGPVGDCELTGRKIIVDTYGGMADMAAELSLARIHQKLTDRQHMPVVMLQKM